MSYSVIPVAILEAGTITAAAGLIWIGVRTVLPAWAREQEDTWFIAAIVFTLALAGRLVAGWM